ncbi:hypothetical protein cypCar_00049542, partial [Cyprinus carpio]
MEVKPMVKMEQTKEISIKESIRYTDMRKITLRDHSYCVSDHAVINDTCNAIQKRIDNDTNSTNQVSHIKTQIERLPIIDKQNDTLSFSSCPSNQSEQEHLSFKLKEENEDEDGLGETAPCEVAAEEEIGLMEDDESTDTDDDVNTDSLPPGDTAYNPDEDFSSEPDDSDSRSSIYGRHRKKKRQKKQTPDSKRPANRNLESVDTAEKSGFQSDSPFCSYGKFAHLEKDMDDCRNKLRLACCLCNMAPFPSKFLCRSSKSSYPYTFSSASLDAKSGQDDSSPLPVNVPLMTSVTCPTLVSALTEHNQPQIPPAKVQAPLKIVAMFVNQSRDLALQKGLEQSWRSKTIFPCRHCGAVSRQPSLK